MGGLVLHDNYASQCEVVRASLSVLSSTLDGPYYAIVTDRGSFRTPYPVPSDSYVWDVYEFPQQASVDAVTASFASTLAVFESSSVLLVDTAWCAAWQGQITVP